MAKKPAAWVYKPIYFDRDAIERIVDAVGTEPPELEEEYRASGASAREFLSIALDGAVKLFAKDSKHQPPSYAATRDYFLRIAASVAALRADLGIEVTAFRVGTSWDHAIARASARWPQPWAIARSAAGSHDASRVLQTLDFLEHESKAAAQRVMPLVKKPVVQQLRKLARQRLAIDLGGIWESYFRKTRGIPFRRFVDAVIREMKSTIGTAPRLTDDVFREARGRKRKPSGGGKSARKRAK